MNEPMVRIVRKGEIEMLLKEMSRFFGPSGDQQFIIPLFGGITSLDPQLYPKPQYEDDIKFTYYGKTDRSSNHDGIITIASVIDEDLGLIYYGASFCSPKDVYDKAYGKELAYNDLCNNRTVIRLRKKGHHEINAGIFANMVANGVFPSWAKSMVFHSLQTHIFRGGM